MTRLRRFIFFILLVRYRWAFNQIPSIFGELHKCMKISKETRPNEFRNIFTAAKRENNSWAADKVGEYIIRLDSEEKKAFEAHDDTESEELGKLKNNFVDKRKDLKEKTKKRLAFLMPTKLPTGKRMKLINENAVLKARAKHEQLKLSERLKSYPHIGKTLVILSFLLVGFGCFLNYIFLEEIFEHFIYDDSFFATHGRAPVAIILTIMEVLGPWILINVVQKESEKLKHARNLQAAGGILLVVGIAAYLILSRISEIAVAVSTGSSGGAH